MQYYVPREYTVNVRTGVAIFMAAPDQLLEFVGKIKVINENGVKFSVWLKSVKKWIERDKNE